MPRNAVSIERARSSLQNTLEDSSNIVDIGEGKY